MKLFRLAVITRLRYRLQFEYLPEQQHNTKPENIHFVFRVALHIPF